MAGVRRRIGHERGAGGSGTIDCGTHYQTLRSFGASDCWNIDFVGRYWSVAEKEKLARLFFSREVDAAGNPRGIALSQWRANIGGGSAEQGADSMIDAEARRAECFLRVDGTYDWTKQAGQQWFLRRAREYGVGSFVAFSNSPPVYFTKNGLAHGTDGEPNLKETHYAAFAQFLGEVLAHFAAQGQPFDYISPINEPQWDWSGKKQEGSRWLDHQVARIARELDTALTARGLSTRIMISEAGQMEHLYRDGATVGRRPARQKGASAD